MNQNKSMHGTSKAIGGSHLNLGNFCKLFPRLPTWAADFAEANQINNIDDEAEKVARVLGGPGGVMHDITDMSGDSSIPAAYTFFAQFVDHDITLDMATNLRDSELELDTIKGLPNLRSASLDLDSVYGFGPDISLHLYERDGRGRLLVGSRVNGDRNPNDVPRDMEGNALLGDSRNDENHFLAQLHLLFLRFHNRLRETFETFEDAQREARYNYQAIVLYDFLSRVCDSQIYDFILKKIENREDTFFSLTPDVSSRICMPVEFSVAAYRFGHTMVRSRYPVNADFKEIEIFDEEFGTTGLRPSSSNLTVDWQLLLDVGDSSNYTRSKAIDHLLADELMHLPVPVVKRDERGFERALAFRNLRRGYVLGLPSGQRIAQAFIDKGYSIDLNDGINFDGITRWQEILRSHRNLDKHTPLFFYLMREAGIKGAGNHLGPVGSAILMEVFGAMLLHSRTSFLRDTEWTLEDSVISKNGSTPTLADLVQYVNQSG